MFRKVDPLLGDSEIETEISEPEVLERCFFRSCRDFLLVCSFLLRGDTFMVDFVRSLVSFAVFFGLGDFSFRAGVGIFSPLRGVRERSFRWVDFVS